MGGDPGDRGFPRPRPAWPNLGHVALAVVAGGLFTGVFLAANYAPTFAAAHASIQHLLDSVRGGRFLHATHYWVGNFAIFLVFLHGLRLFWRGLYKPPRAGLWVLGCGIFLVVVGFAYTGYLLEGDARARMGMQVLSGVAASTPGIGAAARRIALGGDTVSSATLVRIYAVHAEVLPALLLAFVAGYVVLLRKRRQAGHIPPPAAGTATSTAVAALVVFGLLAYCASAYPPHLGPAADLSGPGSPDAVPEWFLMWVHQLLALVSGAQFWIAFALPAGIFLAAAGLPFYARGKEMAPARRIPEIAVFTLILLGIGFLDVQGFAERPSEPAKPTVEPPPSSAVELAKRAGRVIDEFQCRTCHTIDGDPDGGLTGPPLDRDTLGLYFTKKFFRLKVSDPVAFWADTGMTYRGHRKPSPAQVDLLTRYFFEKTDAKKGG